MSIVVPAQDIKMIPEESLCHTVLCNQADLKICTEHKRYADWTKGGWHPKWLDISDAPQILESRAFFARKFRPDEKLQEFFDKEVLWLSGRRNLTLYP